jgi:uncharacterized protein (TIGR03000 family)
VTFSILVPVDAQVFINGRPTKSRGTTRNYVSRGILPGSAYDFHVRVEVVRDGRPVTSERTFRLTAGDHREVAFTLPAERGLTSLVSTVR